MPYIGKSLGNGVRQRYIYAATAGQTSFSGNDSAGISLAYDDPSYLDVYQNGVLLKPVTDYASTTGTSVVLVTGATTDDVVEMITYDTFAIADTVSAKDGGSFAGAVSMASTLAVTGALTATAGASSNAVSLQSANFKMTDLTTNAFYRTGTWTPIISGDNATDGDATIFSTTPATAYGTYTRIGDLVAVSWTYINGNGIGYTNNGSDASHLRIVGLPFSLKNVSTYNPGGIIHDYVATSDWAASYTPMTSGIYNTKKILVHYANGAVMELADAVYWNVANSKFAGSLVYETDEA